MNIAESARVAPLAEIYAHKLFAPPQYHGAIDRTAILDRIFAADRSRIVLLQGPAGHGKSTVMQQAKSVCEAHGTHTGWLTFDDADNDMRRFSIHFQALLTASLGAGVDAPTGSSTICCALAGRWRCFSMNFSRSPTIRS
jgi:LuxR family maltose regulon positive regulatory protein